MAIGERRKPFPDGRPGFRRVASVPQGDRDGIKGLSPRNAFSSGVLTPYLNFHRPCLFPEAVVDAKGKWRKRYPYANLMPPYEKLKSLPEAEQHLKPGLTFKQPDDIAMQQVALLIVRDLTPIVYCCKVTKDSLPIPER